jgi:hypothetical protein
MTASGIATSALRHSTSNDMRACKFMRDPPIRATWIPGDQSTSEVPQVPRMRIVRST